MPDIGIVYLPWSGISHYYENVIAINRIAGCLSIGRPGHKR